MTPTSHTSRWLVLLLAGLLGLGELASPVVAAESSAASPAAALTAPAAVFGGLGDYIIGNRSRMIQCAFIGFVIGVVILMTATRKH